MKYQVLLCLHFFLFFSCSIAQTNNAPPSPFDYSNFKPQFTNNFNPQIYLDNENISMSKNKSTQTSSTSFTIINYVSDYIKSLDPKNYGQYSYQWIKQHKYKIIRYSIFSSYISLWLFLLSSRYYLNKPDSWSQWQANIPFTELCTKPQQLLQQELIFDIQKRYINKQNPTDFLGPFITFIHKITMEETAVNRYVFLLNSINSLYLKRLFFITDKKIKEAEQVKQRIAFVKQLFLTYVAEFNINEYNSRHTKMLELADYNGCHVPS